jgi:hypothetical protein
VNVSALVWYPFAQEHTLLAALGIDAHDPAFLEAQRRQITEVLLAAMGAQKRGRLRPRVAARAVTGESALVRGPTGPAVFDRTSPAISREREPPGRTGTCGH